MLEDPLSDVFSNIWTQLASNNTAWYRRVFRCYPDNSIRSFKQLSKFEAEAEPESYQLLKDNVNGILVEFPLNFLEDENLQISVFSKEFLLPDDSFI